MSNCLDGGPVCICKRLSWLLVDVGRTSPLWVAQSPRLGVQTSPLWVSQSPRLGVPNRRNSAPSKDAASVCLCLSAVDCRCVSSCLDFFAAVARDCKPDKPFLPSHWPFDEVFVTETEVKLSQLSMEMTLGTSSWSHSVLDLWFWVSCWSMSGTGKYYFTKPHSLCPWVKLSCCSHGLLINFVSCISAVGAWETS